VHQLDIKNAFLQGTLFEMIYCSQPVSFVDPAHSQLVCRLNKSLYDMKQAPRTWYHCFSSYLVSLGFMEAKSDTSLFVYRRSANTAYLLLYIDDRLEPRTSPAYHYNSPAAIRDEGHRPSPPLSHHLSRAAV
jgi:hypothetical protein